MATVCDYKVRQYNYKVGQLENYKVRQKKLQSAGSYYKEVHKHYKAGQKLGYKICFWNLITEPWVGGINGTTTIVHSSLHWINISWRLMVNSIEISAGLPLNILLKKLLLVYY